MEVYQKPDPDGGLDEYMRADAEFKNVTVAQLLQYFTHTYWETTPGLEDFEQDLIDPELAAVGDKLLYYSIKFPIVALRDNVLRVHVENKEDGSIFIAMRSWDHPDHPVSQKAIRVYYSNRALFTPTPEGAKMTEIIHMELGGSFAGKLNGTMGKETIKANRAMMKTFRK